MLLSMLWLFGGGGQGNLRRHSCGDGLDDFSQVPTDQAVPCSVDVFGFWVAVARESLAGMLLGRV